MRVDILASLYLGLAFTVLASYNNDMQSIAVEVSTIY